MKLPNADQAFIDPAKLRDYLLSPTHPVGRFKAPFFAAMGYTQTEWQKLEMDLRAQIEVQEAALSTTSRYGQKYEVRAMLIAPDGRSAVLMTVWIVRTGEQEPRFVTAYPGGPQ